MSDNAQQRTSNLFKYIKSVLESTLKVQTDFSSLSFKKFENDFQESKYISSFFNHSEQKEFFIIKYPETELPPKYPSSLEGWIINYPNSPKLVEQVNEYNNEKINNQNKEREQIWQDFKPKLQEWKNRNKNELIIEDLFRTIYTLSSSNDENFEFVLGHGILAWKNFKQVGANLKQTIINYPLITIELQVTYDPASKTLLLEPVEDKTFELEDLVIRDYIQELPEVKDLFSNLEYDITEKSSYISFFENTLNRFTNPLNGTLANGVLEEDKQYRPDKPTSDLKLIDTWGVFYHKRRQNAELRDLENYIDIFESEDNVASSSITSFIEDAKQEPENFDFEQYDETSVLQNKNILFPLPFNKEQVSILNKIENSSSIIVKGPPGTGKSHTIANLISHFLAKGQKVLVTSQKDQALDVLLDKVPEELRKFCIPILSSVTDGKKKMEEAFAGINNAINYSGHSLNREIEELHSSIDKTKEEFIETQNKIKLGSKAQLNKIKYKSEMLLPIDLVQKLKREEEKHAWLQDNVKYFTTENIDNITEVKLNIPIESNQLERLVLLFQELRQDLDDLNKKRISTSLVLSPSDFEDFAKNLLKIQELDNQIKTGFPNVIIKENSINDIEHFMSQIRTVMKDPSLEKNIENLSQNIISSEELIHPEEFTQIINNLIAFQELEVSRVNTIPDIKFNDSSIDDWKDFRTRIQKEIENTTLIKEDWQKDFFNVIQDKDEYQKVSNIISNILSTSNLLEKTYKSYDVFKEVSIKSEYDITNLTVFIKEQVKAIEEGKDVNSFFYKILKSKKDKQTLKSILVDSKKQLETQEEWNQVLTFVEILNNLNELNIQWNKLAKRYKLPIIELGFYKLIENEKASSNLKQYYLDDIVLERQISLVKKLENIQNIYEYNHSDNYMEIEELCWLYINNAIEILETYSLENILKVIDYKIEQLYVKDSVDKANDLKEKLVILIKDRNNHAINKELKDCLDNAISNLEESSINWKLLYEKIVNFEQLQPKYNELKKNIVNGENVCSKYSKREIISLFEYQLNQNNYLSTKTKQEELKEILSTYLNECNLNAQLYKSLDLILVNTEEAIINWSTAYNKLQELELVEDKYNEFLTLFNSLKENAPEWAAQILESENNNFYPEYWKESFEFKVLLLYINEINEIALNLTRYEKKLTKLSQQLRKLKTDLILKTTIKNIKANMSQERLRALESWQLALKKLGKGKGKYAIKKQRQLKEATQQAKGSIPVWIMPLFKVAETIPSEIGIFDVVIIDEASQSDIRAFLPLVRGKKVIIVGDPEQVSPGSVGVDEAQVQSKIKEYLKDIPNGQHFDLKTSIYDIAKATLGGSNVLMLKEHFRCLPEIIRFSNDLSYNGEIIPLRYEPTQKKLTPVLQSIYLSNGIREDNSDINKDEANQICETIQKIITNPAPQYNGKTIGIISLTGIAQAKYIEDQLKKCISTENQIKYKIRVGDAATFQGDERDIIILSMVVSSNDNKRYTALTSDTYRQRFNVAVSRAKDKVILVHSIKLEDISNPSCMRRKLLEFINSGQIEGKKLRDKELFDSDFEEAVYNELVNKGYVITPQVKIGPYRIDLVVEGGIQRLGIECDGDKYHQPDKWFEDNLRQKHLERMGWTIYKIWGSDFYNRKREIIEDIVKKLNKMNISPQTFEQQYKDKVPKEHIVDEDKPISKQVSLFKE